MADYRDLDARALRKIAARFNLDIPGNSKAFHDAFLYNAKRPGRVFESDVEHKREAATDAIRSAADRWAGAAYRKLLDSHFRLRVGGAG